MPEGNLSPEELEKKYKYRRSITFGTTFFDLKGPIAKNLRGREVAEQAEKQKWCLEMLKSLIIGESSFDPY
jgi:hypothetical protein